MLDQNYINLVKVVIPIYKNELSDLEKRSLSQVYDILKNYPLVVIKPESLDLSDCLKPYPLISIQTFNDSFFKGISGYNNLMLSTLFYKTFIDYKYILIYQLDAYVFRDELEKWCAYDYDYVGAPWLKRPIYNLPIISWIMSYSLKRKTRKGQVSKQLLYNKIGNGGFSLRKVRSHYLATKTHAKKINRFLVQRRQHLYNEDVFWAFLPDFSYPTAMEALRFSFDKYPELSYKLINKQLPFGCHGWYKRKMKHFWKPIINY
ncbi:hypothetical protein M2459_000680 [Parabacteroides sp. PF5-5]|uniref:DUF5672 family protein n=1 Tax=unclassified Parabacteroides TaxID=2649774 RepID=UPI002473C31F|nr:MULTISPECIES: DUF5672 family protein [unclassified Parabacteroides]MDH6303386.1 hypothetical protein [Parabacteroides sp. PH5-39]MDH6314709.1 hypothetical protein [Parabacteroides sp. PF5-13]MDH6318046.1 hypothetical protein [Parabacteroides sp. PH5-13]MDH6322023.1 hypothetical protein [Parabacteroides sp. PH5-8]MDH6326146.1 hypothetical protein [Parabacteroides sp. PH5-41]